MSGIVRRSWHPHDRAAFTAVRPEEAPRQAGSLPSHPDQMRKKSAAVMPAAFLFTKVAISTAFLAPDPSAS